MSLQSNDYFLIALLALAVFFDLTRKRIPNFLTLPVIGWGLFTNTISGGLDGFLFSLYGLLLGLGVFLIPFTLGWLGGGDIKLFGAVGALQGAAFVFHAALFTAVCGGLLALFYLLAAKRLLPVLKKILGAAAGSFSFILAIKFRSPAFISSAGFLQRPGADTQVQSPAMPYGVAIALGTLFTLSGAVIFF
jgi:prepilin peptidase CpaA